MNTFSHNFLEWRPNVDFEREIQRNEKYEKYGDAKTKRFIVVISTVEIASDLS